MVEGSSTFCADSPADRRGEDSEVHTSNPSIYDALSKTSSQAKVSTMMYRALRAYPECICKNHIWFERFDPWFSLRASSTGPLEDSLRGNFVRSRAFDES